MSVGESKIISAAVVLIGNELLSGRTTDANLSYIAKGLQLKGIRLIEARVVQDTEDAIVQAINSLRRECTYVLTTGGIGPTHDDITADCIAKAFSVEISINPEAKAVLLEYFDKRGVEANDDRMRMARIPHGATLIDNPVSAAPGFRMDNVFVLAGVPRIMQAMFDNVLPALDAGPRIASYTVVCDLAEGTIASALRELQDAHPSIDIGSYPGNVIGQGRLSIVIKGADTGKLKETAEQLTTSIQKLGGSVLELMPDPPD
ncbi:MAG: hypothetical protein KTR32_27465 [Granulosicoccus sp.]|nr:hypothetical protein [Granulosicoccus sp.]